jgi:DNA repair exonuclease SbcCD ATPase subunit
MFIGHDLTLLGDIHKMQFLNADRTVAYAGSLIQQNHAEELTHGILVWDLESRSAEFVAIENDYGYYTFNVVNGNVTNVPVSLPRKPRLRLKIYDTNSADVKSIIALLKHKYDVQEIAIQKVNTNNTVNITQRINFGDIRNVEWQNKIITEYLVDEFAVDDVTLDTIRHINRMVHTKLPDQELTRNVVWIPKSFEFSNMFSYGENNVINFENVNGVNGLFAPNASGKSTLLDAIAFCCFDKCSRTSKAIHVLNNKKSSFEAVFQFELGNKRYFVKRYGTKNTKGHVKVDVDFWYLDEYENRVLLNGDQRDSTNKNIRSYLGSYEDFVLTALSLQNNNTGFIDMAQRERKDLLSQFLDIDVFEMQYQIANEEIRDTASILKEYKRNDYSSVLADSQRMIDELNIPLKDIHDKIASLHVVHDKLNNSVVNLTAELKYIDDELANINAIELNKTTVENQVADLENTITDSVNDISSIESQLSNLQQQIDGIDVSTLKNVIDNINELTNVITARTNEIAILSKDIKHAEGMLSKLETHIWNPDCESCMANPWLQETTQIINTLPALKQNFKVLQDELISHKKQLDKLNALDPHTQLKTRDDLLYSGKQLYNRLINKRNLLEANKLLIVTYKEKLDSITQLLQKAESRKDDIEFNNNKRQEIHTIKLQTESVNNELKALNDELLTLTGKIEICKRDKQEAINSINRMRELELQFKAYEYYLQAIKRDGVPYQLISKALPQIEAEINNILTQIVDFTILLETDGKNINGYIVYDSSNYWPLELTSGMEKFISSLAIRASLINITSLPRPNFLAIDEGFGVLDSDNLNSMYLLFDYLKTQFNFILCISHIDAMRDVVDKLIEIKKENTYSQINYV